MSESRRVDAAGPAGKRRWGFNEARKLLRFTYTNWRGDEHVYVIQPESVEWGRYEQGGVGAEEQWYMHGWVVTRDGEPRPELGRNRRRTFEQAAMRLVEVVGSDGAVV